MAWRVVSLEYGCTKLSRRMSRPRALRKLLAIGNCGKFAIDCATGERIKEGEALDDLFPKRIARDVPRALIMLQGAIIAGGVVGVILIILKTIADLGAGR